MIRRSGAIRKADWGRQEQTWPSGIRAVPFMTVFPLWFRLILNPIVLYPLFIIQRMFYHADLGLEMMALAQIPEDGVERMT
jgi:hypothetical protein